MFHKLTPSDSFHAGKFSQGKLVLKVMSQKVITHFCLWLQKLSGIVFMRLFSFDLMDLNLLNFLRSLFF